jgi:threonine dehydrogenase-like Zn-dependent dehydrogenase
LDVKALVKTRPQPGLDLLDVPEPIAAPGEVLIRVEAAAVCGSDIGRYAWTRNYGAGAAKAMVDDLPRILGHEFAGTVVGLGDGVAALPIGARVAVQNVLGCGRCPECDRGLPNLCVRRRTIGVHTDGGYAELAAVPARNCYVMPDSMGFHLAAGLQPFAVGTNAVDQADLEPGERIVVWGAGPIGLAIVFAARVRGVDNALVLDISEDRLRDAAPLGVETLHVGGKDAAVELLARVGKRSVDAVFDAAGAAGSIPASLPVLRKRRTMVLVGNPREDVHADLLSLVMDQQRLAGARSYSLAAWNLALRTIEPSGFAATLGAEVPMAGALVRFEDAVAGRGGPFTILPNV